MFFIAFTLAKLADWIIHTFNLGSGSTWPGEVALRFDPHFVRHSLDRTPVKVILVAGTNGKTTTSLLIRYGLQKAGRKVIHNAEGANLLNGVASSLIRSSPVLAGVSAEYAVFELDENAFSHILLEIQNPHAVVLLNLFRDQLDRYGEVNAISARWTNALSHLSKKTVAIINGDDPRLTYIGKNSSALVFYFGAEQKDKQKKDIPHDVDSVYCPRCGNKLNYSVMSYSHLGDFSCSSCQFSSPEKWTESLPAISQFPGTYNRYNVRAVVLTLSHILGITPQDALSHIKHAHPAFGRQEQFEARGKKWIAILSKNPSGFNQSIDSLHEILGNNKTTICIILNDRIPDGTDVSWIWDVEFEKVFQFAHSIVVSGDRTYDAAIRMETASAGKYMSTALTAECTLKNALSLAAQKENNNPIIILATYTGMLEARKLLLGRALL